VGTPVNTHRPDRQTTADDSGPRPPPPWNRRCAGVTKLFHAAGRSASRAGSVARQIPQRSVHVSSVHRTSPVTTDLEISVERPQPGATALRDWKPSADNDRNCQPACAAVTPALRATGMRSRQGAPTVEGALLWLLPRPIHHLAVTEVVGETRTSEPETLWRTLGAPAANGRSTATAGVLSGASAVPAQR
jgi:hypothetical protein